MNSIYSEDKFGNFLVDSHCHLSYYESVDVCQIMQRCAESNVRILHNICVDIMKFSEVLRDAIEYDNIFCSLGTHPCHVNDAVVTVERITEIYYKHNSKIISIGETGLDFININNRECSEMQKRIFNMHIEAASILNLPLVIHTRGAEVETYEVLRDASRGANIRGVIHCFTGSRDFLFKMLDLGYYISISGIVTFKNATALQDLVSYIPMEFLLLETDSPYLAPTPMRGRRNEPAFVRFVLEFLSKQLKINENDMMLKTTSNFFDLFQGAAIMSSN